jgi:AmmeMemoRadiSam system protein B
MSLRPGVPLHATLLELVQVAAKLLKASGLGVEHARSIAIDVSVLSDPAMHGTVAEPAVDGLSADEPRAIVVAQGNRSCWVADRDLATGEVIDKAFSATGIRQSSSAAIYSLAISSTAWPVQQVNIPQPLVTRIPRKPAVAGMFYPDEPTAMRQELDALFQQAATVPRQRWRAAMVPHAGWKYSGRIAAQVLQQIDLPETVIVLSPKHTRFGVDWAIAPCQSWEIPGGQVAANLELANALVRRLPEWQFDAAAHKQEHGIEVELPLIAHLAPHTRIVGITIGAGEWEDCQRFAEGLAEVLRPCSEAPLLLISSDMNHFASDSETRRLDELALECLDQLDAAGLYRVVRDNHISMCGMLPAVIALETLQRLRPMERAQRVAYATTADTTGNPDRVVGYAGMLFN